MTCVHQDPSRALGDLTRIKKHFCRKHDFDQDFFLPRSKKCPRYCGRVVNGRDAAKGQWPRSSRIVRVRGLAFLRCFGYESVIWYMLLQAKMDGLEHLVVVLQMPDVCPTLFKSELHWVDKAIVSILANLPLINYRRCSLLIRASTTSKCPFRAAECKEVFPLFLAMVAKLLFLSKGNSLLEDGPCEVANLCNACV
ncbi:hypothetical protein Nepgr_019328 [Nepenthes gracilis]|uniref:BIRD-IDD transcription factor second C2H2 zinc finger domain-containing protein n=1 Tax=Nepenthes gracilis TaxID=150966 RepID=A0AAD3XTY2_NEPGR|nr:hypothetical protein Nepgr_019328 [Nepenthes gracilis]